MPNIFAQTERIESEHDLLWGCTDQGPIGDNKGIIFDVKVTYVVPLLRTEVIHVWMSLFFIIEL